MIATAEEIEIETYRECALCCNIINKNDKSFYFWDSERLVNVCRNCAGELLEKGEGIIGTTKSLKETRMGKVRGMSKAIPQR
jgi:hypothetical protein